MHLQPRNNHTNRHGVYNRQKQSKSVHSLFLGRKSPGPGDLMRRNLKSPDFASSNLRSGAVPGGCWICPGCRILGGHRVPPIPISLRHLRFSSFYYPYWWLVVICKYTLLEYYDNISLLRYNRHLNLFWRSLPYPESDTGCWFYDGFPRGSGCVG